MSISFIPNLQDQKFLGFVCATLVIRIKLLYISELSEENNV